MDMAEMAKMKRQGDMGGNMRLGNLPGGAPMPNDDE